MELLGKALGALNPFGADAEPEAGTPQSQQQQPATPAAATGGPPLQAGVARRLFVDDNGAGAGAGADEAAARAVGVAAAVMGDQVHTHAPPEKKVDGRGDAVLHRPAGHARFEGPLFAGAGGGGGGGGGEPHFEDLHQGCLGDCYFMAGLILVARHDPQAIADAIKPVGTDKGTGVRSFDVTFRHYNARCARMRPANVTVRVNDVFYTNPLAHDLGFDSGMVEWVRGGREVGLADVLADEKKGETKAERRARRHARRARRRARLDELAFLRGVRQGDTGGGAGDGDAGDGDAGDSDASDGRLFERLRGSRASLYANTGDRTPDGCIWPMLLEKAWALYLCREVHEEGAGRESYSNIDAENNLGGKTTVGDVCLAVAGWKGESESDAPLRLHPPPAAGSNMVHRMQSTDADDNLDAGFIAADVRYDRDALVGGRLFLTYVLLWITTAGTETEKRRNHHPYCTRDDAQGLTEEEVDALFDHVCAGQPAALLTTAKDCAELEAAGLHAAHAYPVVHVDYGNRSFLAIRNPHNRKSKF